MQVEAPGQPAWRGTRGFHLHDFPLIWRRVHVADQSGAVVVIDVGDCQHGDTPVRSANARRDADRVSQKILLAQRSSRWQRCQAMTVVLSLGWECGRQRRHRTLEEMEDPHCD